MNVKRDAAVHTTAAKAELTYSKTRKQLSKNEDIRITEYIYTKPVPTEIRTRKGNKTFMRTSILSPYRITR